MVAAACLVDDLHWAVIDRKCEGVPASACAIGNDSATHFTAEPQSPICIHLIGRSSVNPPEENGL